MSAQAGWLDLPAAQALAQDLLRFAVNDEHGRSELDPIYVRVTENRDGPTPELRRKYSSCGDPAHWLLRCLGLRASWLNRNDDGDSQPFRYSVNLNWLVPPPVGRCPIAKPTLQCEPAVGDIFVERSASGGHVYCAIEYDAGTDTLTTAEYGQPGGSRKRRGGFRSAHARNLMSHIRLVDVLPLLTAPPDYDALLAPGESRPEAGFPREHTHAVPGVQDLERAP